MMGVEASFEKAQWEQPPASPRTGKLCGIRQLEYEVEGEKHILHQGDSYYVAPDQLHGATALEDAVILDIFTPQREDFL